jgi:biotin synthase-like enzyme
MERQLKEGIDFYFNEKGLMVLTESFHLKRGYCCKNNCKHCPYKKNADDSGKKLK